MKICETFRSLQGEGKRIGSTTFFIRAVGCNLSCSWCDTRYAMKGGSEMSVDEIVRAVGDEPEVCFTGGEPLIQDDAIELITRLSDLGKTVVVETNGSVDISEIPERDNVIISMDIKCPSSGMENKMRFENLKLLRQKDQVKFIIEDGNDFNHAIHICEKYRPDTEIIFSPVGGMDLEPLAEEAIQCGLRVRVLPQLHKLIWGNQPGV